MNNLDLLAEIQSMRTRLSSVETQLAAESASNTQLVETVKEQAAVIGGLVADISKQTVLVKDVASDVAAVRTPPTHTHTHTHTHARA